MQSNYNNVILSIHCYSYDGRKNIHMERIGLNMIIEAITVVNAASAATAATATYQRYGKRIFIEFGYEALAQNANHLMAFFSHISL